MSDQRAWIYDPDKDRWVQLGEVVAFEHVSLPEADMDVIWTHEPWSGDPVIAELGLFEPMGEPVPHDDCDGESRIWWGPILFFAVVVLTIVAALVIRHT